LKKDNQIFQKEILSFAVAKSAVVRSQNDHMAVLGGTALLAVLVLRNRKSCYTELAVSKGTQFHQSYCKEDLELAHISQSSHFSMNKQQNIDDEHRLDSDFENQRQ